MAGGTRFLDGIWAAVPTPFHPDGALDHDGIARNVRHLCDSLRLDGIFCNGLMGEGWSLTLRERQEVLETMLSAAGRRLRIGVVVTHHSLRETIDLARHAADVGADHVVLMRPAGPLTADDLHRYVAAVARRAGLPVVLFDSAAQSGGYPAELIERLAGEGLIVGIKCTRGLDATVELISRCGDRIAVCDPHEANWLTLLVRFDRRTLYADPEPYLFQTPTRLPISEMFAAYTAGDYPAAINLHRRLEPLRRVYARWIIDPLRHGLAPNAALKLWCERMGMASGPVRPPLAPLSSDRRAALLADLDEAFAQVGADHSPSRE